MTPRLAALPARDLGGGLRVATASSYLRAAARADGARRRSTPTRGSRSPAAGPCTRSGCGSRSTSMWLDAEGAVVRVDRDVRPFRLRSCREARSVIEVAAGRGDAFAAALLHPASVAPARLVGGRPYGTPSAVPDAGVTSRRRAVGRRADVTPRRTSTP